MAIEIGFIGGGQMATALAQGAIAEGVMAPDEVGFVEPNGKQQAKLRERFPQATIAVNAADLVPKCEKVILAVKPNVLTVIAESIGRLLKDQLVISIAAGVSLPKLVELLGHERIVRVMPNTPSLVGDGASAFAVSSEVNPEDTKWVEQMLTAVGVCIQVPDELIHAVIGVSGSGPAYGYMAIEALSDGGVAAGLTRADAIVLAAQTLLGAARMVLETHSHPGELKDQVASPGGTTAAAIASLEATGFRNSLIKAVAAAAKRSRELGGE
ncbi:MAG TPA: pyrroline-5-carboxylate reductase [Planctomycetaceae bacterium]|nr:pyrroline-5-carboxylate reductase [Planctomycetaceae bacterium]